MIENDILRGYKISGEQMNYRIDVDERSQGYIFTSTSPAESVYMRNDLPLWIAMKGHTTRGNNSGDTTTLYTSEPGGEFAVNLLEERGFSESTGQIDTSTEA